ncbi:MAG: molecular chaperone DnaJ [Deltaproteobacteria bacterium]|nr:molecular chaperone DnaJ [Deltaproteobacteria bacterium]
MPQGDYYKVLGVERGASDDEIKRAYRKLAMDLHPDRHHGDKAVEERFKAINQAYEVLKDPSKRAQYDHMGFVGAGTDSADYGFGNFQDFFNDVFSDFFGAARRRSTARHGADLRYDLEISFEESAKGAEKKIKVPRTRTCAVCSGTRTKPGTQPQTCKTCNGAGQVRFQQGFMSIARTCPECRGEGSVIKDPCETCRGTGRTKSISELNVKIPAGVDTGSRLRMSGEGEPGDRGGHNGDLYIVISVLPHPIFRRENDDIVCEMPISFPQAALGVEIDVPTLDGAYRLKIPPATQSGKVFTLRGKGVPSLQSRRRGDQHIIAKVETPVKLTKRQRELIEELASISGDDTMPLKKTFFDKVREIALGKLF